MHRSQVYMRIKGFISGIGVSSFGLLLALVYQVLLARLMGPEDFGIYTFTIATVTFLTVILDAGVYEATARFLSVRLGAGQKIIPLIKSTLLFTFIVSLVVTFSAVIVMNIFFSSSVYASGIKTFIYFIPALYFLRWSGAVLKGTGQNMKYIFIEQFAFNLIIITLVLLVWNFTGNLSYAIVAVGLSYAFVFIMELYVIYKNYPNEEPSRDRFPIVELIKHGFPLNLTAMGSRMFRRGDIIVIGSLLSPQHVSLYKALYIIISGIKQIVGPISNFSLFYISREVGKGNASNIYSEYILAVWVSAIITTPAFFLLILFQEQIYQLVYVGKYILDVEVVMYLVPGFVVFSCIGPVGSLFNAIGRNWLRMTIVVATGLLNIFLNMFFIKAMGISGAAFATMISMIILSLSYAMIIVRQSSKVYVPIIILFSSISILMLLVLKENFDGGLSLYGCSVLVAISYLLFMFAFARRIFLRGSLTGANL